MLPLMLGLLVGRDRLGPRDHAASAATRSSRSPAPATLVVGMFLLSRLGVDTAPWLASLYMLVVGVGIGLVMQVLVLVVQNDAQPENIGVATSTATFFRSMGGSFGVAIFGAIFAARLSDQLAHFPRDGRRPPGQRRPAQPGRGRHACRRPSTPSSSMPSRTRCTACSCSGLAIAIIPFVLSWFLKEVPLRTTLARQPSVLGAEEAPGGGTPPEKLIEV